jgi:hypothetical protein
MTPEQRALRDRFAAVPESLARAARSANSRPSAPGEWSSSDIVRHLIAVDQEVWEPRLRQVATENDPAWPWVEPDRWNGAPGASLDELLDEFAARRSSMVAGLDGLDERGWARAGTHATYGRLDVAGLIERAADHDEEHLASLA